MTVEIDRTTKTRLITRGKSSCLGKTSVTKKPMDCKSEAWQSENKVARTKKGQTEASLYESLANSGSLVLTVASFGKVKSIPIAAIPPHRANT
mgnify:CR=1 FL=1